MSSNRHSGDENSFLRHYPSTPHLDKYRTTPNPNGNKSTVLINSSSNANFIPSSYMPKTTLSTFASHKSKQDLRFRDDPNPYKVSDIDEFRIKVHDPFIPKSMHRSQQVLTFYEDGADLPYVMRNEHNGNGSPLSALDDEPYNRQKTYDKYSISSGSTDYYTPVQRSQTMKDIPRHKTMSTSSRRSNTSRSHTSGSISVSSNGDVDDGVGECEIPEPDYEGSGSIMGGSDDIPIPIPDSSCSEEYSSVSAGSDPDHYTLGQSGAQSPSPDMQEHERLGADSGLDTPTKVTNDDRMKIEYALKGRKTTVFVADSLANLYIMKKSAVASKNQPAGSTEDWVLKYTGVPVLLLDSGETKSRDKRRIQIVLAELSSGLALWKDVIDNLTSYKVMEGSLTFHTMHLSSDHTKIIGLSFDDEEGAVGFSERVDKLTSDFSNISLSGSKTKNKNKKDKTSAKATKPSKFVKPKKSEISQPCCFHHISSLSSTDRGRLSSLQNFIVNSDNETETFPQNQNSSPSADFSSAKHSVSVISSGSEISF